MNVVVKESAYTERDLCLIFGEEVVYIFDKQPIQNLLKNLGIYPSTSKAIQAGKSGDIPSGYSEYKASKKVTLFIWNPSD